LTFIGTDDHHHLLEVGGQSQLAGEGAVGVGEDILQQAQAVGAFAVEADQGRAAVGGQAGCRQRCSWLDW
jgi:hypothetical protein